MALINHWPWTILQSAGVTIKLVSMKLIIIVKAFDNHGSFNLASIKEDTGIHRKGNCAHITFDYGLEMNNC